jgi:L-threonylcarbamoyladenylate synthase
MLINKKDYKLAIEYLLDEEVIALPTETVMGFAIKSSSLEAYNKLVETKNRPKNKAFPFVVHNKSEIYKYAVVDEISKKIIDAFMPGPLTIILKKKDNVDSRITNNQDTIAIRIPLDPTLLKIVKGLKEPILLTSANKSGEQSCVNSEEVEKIFKDEVPLIIKGKCKHNYASTIVEIKDKNVNIIREGVIKKEEIERLIKVCE